MRTTLELDDDIMVAARSLALTERRPLGKVVSDLARRGLHPDPGGIVTGEDFPTFRVPVGAPAITPEMVQAARDEP